MTDTPSHKHSFSRRDHARKPARKPAQPLTGELRKGWSTGACAAGAASAAYRAVLTGAFAPTVTITLPRGDTPTFALSSHAFGHVEPHSQTPNSNPTSKSTSARAGIIKDAGDDPDITHGLEIIAEIEPAPPCSGVLFKAGEGVGTVTLPGLPLAVGEPAINPGPRAYITTALHQVAVEVLGPEAPIPDVTVTVFVPGGADVAQKTHNPRLGIVGGLSILGTTGVVVPYSCSSWIHSIHRGVDVARAQGIAHILASTGRTSEASANRMLCFPDYALIDMGDFAGGLLKYLRANPVPFLTIAGGFAKMVKLAQGHMDLHSARAQIDFTRLADTLSDARCPEDVCHEARSANTAHHAFLIAGENGPALADRIARQARETAMATLSGGTQVNVWVFDRDGRRIGSTT